MNKVKKLLPIICITCIMLSLTVGLYYRIISYEKQRCFDRLGEYVSTFNNEITVKFDDEIEKLRAIGELLSVDNNLDRRQMVSLHIDKLKNSTFYSRIDVLFQDGSFVTNGSVLSGSASSDYKKLFEKGEHMSHRTADFVSGKKCLYYFIPISDQSGTAAVLIGVIDVQGLGDLFVSRIYKNESFYCVVDSYDGNYIMDSWHGELGNAYETEERQRDRGYENIDLKEETKNLKTGVIAFKSETNGKTIYMHYTPLGIYNWQMMLFVQDDVIFKTFNYMKALLFITAGVEIAAMLIYFLWNLRALYVLEQRNAEIAMQREQLKQLSYRDLLTSMFNRNKYIETINRLSEPGLEKTGAIYVDMNGLKRINDLKSHAEGDRYICTAADIIKGLFPGQSYRIGGDEFVVLAQPIEKDSFDKKVESLKEQAAREEVSISVGAAFEQKCNSLEQLLRTAEQRMYENKQEYYAEVNGKGSSRL